MAAGTYNIYINQGSDWATQIVVREDGVVKDITGYLARAQMRSTKKSDTVSANFVCDIPTPTNGIVVMSLPNATSSAMNPARYYYDLEIYTAGDAIVLRLLNGTSIIDGEVTKP
jgi:hypothetical protein